MPRYARMPSESGYYHVVNRGIGKQILFEEEEDYERFLDTLKRYQLSREASWQPQSNPSVKRGYAKM